MMAAKQNNAPEIAAETSNTFTTTDIRQAVAYGTVKDYGAAYLNPIIGSSAGATCANIATVMMMFHGLLNSTADIDEHRYALALLIQATWSAAQYEESVLSESAVSHG